MSPDKSMSIQSEASPLPAIPGYEPVRSLGVNGGTVYLARRSISGELVAMKVSDSRSAEWVRQYALRQRLDHPNILRIFEIGEFQGRSYCACEYVDGESLAARLRQGPLSTSHAISLVSALVLAIQYAWHQGLAPVGLAPDSIVLSAEGVPKLCDFETRDSDATPPTKMFGPPGFMAPEEAGGMPTGVTTLVYRVGGVIYAVLTGQPPFAGDHYAEILVKVLRESPAPPRRANATVDRDLEAICMKCLQKWPESRYSSLEELAAQLTSLNVPADPGAVIKSLRSVRHTLRQAFSRLGSLLGRFR